MRGEKGAELFSGYFDCVDAWGILIVLENETQLMISFSISPLLTEIFLKRQEVDSRIKISIFFGRGPLSFPSSSQFLFFFFFFSLTFFF